jgi:hypothetical protein
MIFRDNKAAQIARMYVGQTKNPVPVIMGEDHIHNIHERQLLKVIVGYAYLRPI